MKYFGFVTLLTTSLLILFSSTIAQINAADLLEEKLDSILLTYDIDELKSELSKTELNYKNDDRFNSRIKPYKDLIRKIHLLLSKEVHEKTEAIEKYILAENHFEIRKAGKASNISYKKFKDAERLKQTDQAIVIYSIAYFQKLKFSNNIKVKISNHLENANNFYNLSHYEKAKENIDEIYLLSEGRPYLKPWIDSVRTIQSQVEANLTILKNQKKFYSRKEICNNKFQISYSLQAANSFPFENVVWDAEKNGDVVQYKINKIPATYGFSHRIDFSFNFSPNFSIGSNIRYGNFIYNDLIKHYSVIINKVEQEVVHSSIFVTGKYYFRDKIGARPYIQVGIGYAKFERKDFQAIVLTIVKEKFYRTIRGKSVEKMQYLVEGGVDFVMDNYNYLVYGFYFAAHYNNYQNDFVNKFSLAAALKLGVRF